VRALGIDLGDRRIGIAVSSGSVASPVETVQRSGDRDRDHRRILEIAAEWEADTLVVGLPLSLDGSEGPAAVAVLEEVAELRVRTSIAVETYDERLTTVTADRQLQELGVHGRDRRRMIDQLAASVFLQAWLDGRAECRNDRELL
jgi:putative Holliday junction resolvase